MVEERRLIVNLQAYVRASFVLYLLRNNCFLKEGVCSVQFVNALRMSQWSSYFDG
jgi:hypothetical protein